MCNRSRPLLKQTRGRKVHFPWDDTEREREGEASSFSRVWLQPVSVLEGKFVPFFFYRIIFETGTFLSLKREEISDRVSETGPRFSVMLCVRIVRVSRLHFSSFGVMCPRERGGRKWRM